MQKTEQRALTVSQLTFQIRGTLEERFTNVLVRGEISSWSHAPSGHSYFCLKDEGAILSAVLWKSAIMRLPFKPKDGLEVEARGKLSLFEKRGQYQLIVDSMTLAGEGELWARFQKLKEKLEADGLFDPGRKRPIPVFPHRVGVVTSPTGAVIRDILTVLQRRAPSLSVLLYPTRVQGTGAAREITTGVEKLSRSGLVDLLIVGRGGGSLEDLWEFNDETLARAIYNCPIPVISAVGHETDFSISDFVADLRAPTPSAAAEIVSEGYLNLYESINSSMQRSRRCVESLARDTRRRVEGMLASHALRQPELLFREYQQRVDYAMKRSPEIIARAMERKRAQIERLNGGLEGHNPKLILDKGYAIVRRAKDGKVLASSEKLKKNMAIDLELRDGSRRAVVTDDQADDLFS